MSDLIIRLRLEAKYDKWETRTLLLREAADSLESLTAQLAAVGAMLKTGGMNDGYFMSGQIRALLEQLAERDQTIARLKAERERNLPLIQPTRLDIGL